MLVVFSVPLNVGWLRRDFSSMRGKRQVALPENMIFAVRQIAWWSTDLRYDPRDLDPRLTRDFLAYVNSIFSWTKGRVS